jgi:hypothetical protein
MVSKIPMLMALRFVLGVVDSTAAHVQPVKRMRPSVKQRLARRMYLKHGWQARTEFGYAEQQQGPAKQ